MKLEWGNNQSGGDYLSPKDYVLLLCALFTVACPIIAYAIFWVCLYLATFVIEGAASIRDVVSMLDVPKDMKMHLRHIGMFSLGLSFLIGFVVAYKAGQVGLVRHSYVFWSVTAVFCGYVLVDWVRGDIWLGPLLPRLSELSVGTLLFLYFVFVFSADFCWFVTKAIQRRCL